MSNPNLPLEVEVQKRKKVTTTNEDGTISEGYKYRLDITGDDMPVFWTATFGQDILNPGDILELTELISQTQLDDAAEEDEDEELLGDMRAYLADATVDEIEADLEDVDALPQTQPHWDDVTVAYVEALMEAERTGPHRETALDVMQEKHDELTGDGEE